MTSIRSYQASDRDQLVALWQSVFPNDPPHNAPDKVIDEKCRVDNLLFVAETNQSIVGACMAGYDGHRGWLYAVAVLPEYRRNAVGKQLVEHAVMSLKKRGCGKVNLQIRADNTEVAAFYQSLGFDIEERMSMGRLL